MAPFAHTHPRGGEVPNERECSFSVRLPAHYQVYEVEIAGQRRRYLGLRLDAVRLQGGLLRECVLGELDPRGPTTC